MGTRQDQTATQGSGARSRQAATSIHPLPMTTESPSETEQGQGIDATQAVHALLGAIFWAHRQRQDYLNAELALANVLRSIERRALTFDPLPPGPVVSAPPSSAQATVSGSPIVPAPESNGAGKAGSSMAPKEATPSLSISAVTVDLRSSIAELHKKRLRHERDLVKLAERHPLWSWVKEVRGIGALSFGQILAEAGRDIAEYENPAKLWQRFGLGLVNGEIQRRRKGAKGALMGFSPRRRALAFVVSENLVKLNKGEFRAYYDSEKARQHEKIPDASDGHCHKRALRHMAKRFLRELWRAAR